MTDTTTPPAAPKLPSVARCIQILDEAALRLTEECDHELAADLRWYVIARLERTEAERDRLRGLLQEKRITTDSELDRSLREATKREVTPTERRLAAQQCAAYAIQTAEFFECYFAGRPSFAAQTYRDTAHHLEALAADNDRLLKENEVLLGRIDDLTANINVLASEHTAERGRLRSALLSIKDFFLVDSSSGSKFVHDTVQAALAADAVAPGDGGGA